MKIWNVKVAGEAANVQSAAAAEDRDCFPAVQNVAVPAIAQFVRGRDNNLNKIL